MGDSELEVLKGIDLRIEEGEFVAIMGPSGSGKSTLMQILGLLDRPSSGAYRLMGRDVSRLSDDEGAALRSRTIGFVFQMFNLLARTSAADNVALPMIYAGAEGRPERAREMLRRVGLEDRLDHKPNQLSGGQQQRVAIARALVNGPRVLFADEPTGNLASAQAEEVLRQLRELHQSGLTLILVTHEPDIAAYAERIVRIKDGSIVSDERKGRVAAAVLTVPGIDFHLGESQSLAPSLQRPGESQSLVPSGPLSGVAGAAGLRENVAAALRAMAANKLRSALSMLGILIGVAAVIAMLAVGRGAQKAIEARISSLGSNLVMLFPGGRSVGGVHMAAGGFSRLTLEDMAAIAKADPKILRVDGNVDDNVQAVYEDQNVNTQLTGATERYAPMRASQPYYGRFFTAEENERQERVAVLGQTVINALFGKENPVGKSIKINRVNFEVIGVLPMKGASAWRDQDDKIVVPLKTAMKRVLGRKYLGSISIECDAPENIPAVMQSVERLMRHRHHLPAYKENDFEIRNLADIQAALSGTTQTFTLLLGIVAAISLVVGGIGIMNIMLVSVSERTREIGLRKAVGAPRRAILAQFLIESAVLSTVGGLIGIALGIGVSLILSKFAGWAAFVTPQAVMMAFAFSAGVGLLFGYWPARKASLLSPIEALRYE